MDVKTDLLANDPLCAVTVEQLRNQLRDKPQFNEVWPEVWSDEELADAIIDAIADFNGAPPIDTSFDHKDFPDRKLLMDMSVAQALEELILWHARLQNTTSDAGLQVNIHEQWAGLQTILDRMNVRIEKRVADKKNQINIKRGWGGVGSALRWG